MKMKQKNQLIRTQKVKQNPSNQFINHFKFNKNIRQSFLFNFIFSHLNLNIDETASHFTQFSYGVFLLSLVAMFCFINVIGFLITYILIQQGDYENKYPKFKKIINYFKKSTLLYVAIEALLCLSCLILLVCFSFINVTSGINT